MRYELIDKNNLILATRVQLEIFPKESAYYCYKKSIEDNHKHLKYYLVYKENVIVGITGLYISNDCNDSVWLGWYGVLENYRLHGFGKQILLDTIGLAKEWSKQDNNIKFLRLYTSERDNSVAQILYKKQMDIVERYNNPNDVNYDNTCLIYSKSLYDDIEVSKWDNKFLNLKESDELIESYFKEFIELTNGDIHIQIAPTGEVF